MSKFIQGEALNVDGDLVPAWGLLHDGVFIVNARASACCRFHEFPELYGLTEAEADELARLNAGRNLMAYWDWEG